MRAGVALGLAVAGLGASAPVAAATMQIVDQDGNGEGLNDQTPVSPADGNPGQTLGAKRRIALQYAANILGSRLASPVPIRIATQFNTLACSANSATLGQAAPAQFSADFAHAPRTDTFYPIALANAAAGRRIAAGTNDISAVFNTAPDSGNNDCLQGARWYYGLDGAHPSNRISFVSTAVHELIHGLGFVSEVAMSDSDAASVGQFPRASDGTRMPDIFSRFIQDLSMPGQPLWTDMTATARARSLTDGPDVVWSNANTNSQAATILTAGLNRGRVELYAPSPIEAGSSISHWDPSLSPDQIMEPFATEQNNVSHGIGLAACVLENIGWQLTNDIRCPDVDSATIAGQGDTAAVSPDNGAGASAGSANDDSDNGGGGGCAIDPDARFDPLWCGLLILAVLALVTRRRHAR